MSKSLINFLYYLKINYINKKVITFLLCFIITFFLLSIYYFLIPHKYLVTSIIEIGTINNDFIEKPKTTRVRLIHSIIPTIVNESKDDNFSLNSIDVKVILSGDNRLMLQSYYDLSNLNYHTFLHKSIINKLIYEHSILAYNRILPKMSLINETKSEIDFLSQRINKLDININKFDKENNEIIFKNLFIDYLEGIKYKKERLMEQYKDLIFSNEYNSTFPKEIAFLSNESQKINFFRYLLICLILSFLFSLIFLYIVKKIKFINIKFLN